MDECKLGLYLHIPFCETICNYCNFNRGLFNSSLKDRYLVALESEISRIGDGTSVDTIYFGGGTPSLLSPDEVFGLLNVCRNVFDVDVGAEVTLEVNPETATTTSMKGWLEAGISRVSFGVQSFLDTELCRLGRSHSAVKAQEALNISRDVGCQDVSLDLMLWLPEQTRKDCRSSIETLISLNPDHASLYMLELYPNSPLKEEIVRSGWSLAPDEDGAAMYLDSLQQMDQAGYQQYEISNVARNGKQCRHNIKYWRDGEWIGFGCGAHSTRGNYRWKNISETEQYISMILDGESGISQRRLLTREEKLGDALVTGLRLVDGINLDRIEFMYEVDVMERYGFEMEAFLEDGLLLYESGWLKLTRQGMLLSNEVMRTFV